MNVQDVLNMAGSQPFSTFKWGVAVVLVLNDLLPLGNKLTVDSTGHQAILALSTLPTGVALDLYTREVQLLNDNLIIKPPANPAGGVPPTAPVPKRNNVLVVAVMVILGVIVLGLTVTTANEAHRTGQTPDMTALVDVIKIMVEFAKEETERGNTPPPVTP